MLRYQIDGTMLAAINNYVTQVEKVYQNEKCLPLDTCSDEVVKDNIVGNPIYGFQVIVFFPRYFWLVIVLLKST